MPINTVDEQFQIGMEDLQMKEAVHIVKDMIQMESNLQPSSSSTASQDEFLPTGS